MFIVDTDNLIERKRNVVAAADDIKTLEFKQMKEALEIQGSLLLTNEQEILKVDHIYGVSFLIAMYYSFCQEVEKEVNVHYWEDHGHRIDIFYQLDGIKIIDSNTIDRKNIKLSFEEFNIQFSDILKSIQQLCFSVYYPIIDRVDYYKEIEKMSEVKLVWSKPIA